MANKERDVSLVIRAKEQSKKAIDSVADALRDLESAQSDFGKSAAKTGGLVDRLQAAFNDLDREMKGLAALDKVAANMDKAADAVGRLDAEVKSTVANQEKLANSIREAAENTARLKAAADTAKEAYDKQRAAVANLTSEQRKEKTAVDALRKSRDELKVGYQQAQSALNSAERQERSLADQLERSKGSLEAQQQALSESNAELAQIAALAQKASSALGGVEATQEAVARASARAAAEQERLKQALNQTASGGTRRLLQGGVVADSNQASAVVAALKAYREAEQELLRLSKAMEVAGGESGELQRDLDLATVAARNAAAEYKRLKDAMQQAASARRALSSSGADAVTAGGSGVASVPRTVPSSMREATAEGNKLRDAFKGIYGESRQAMNLFQRFRGEVLSLTSSFVGLYAAIAGVGSVINTAIQYQSAFNKLMVVTGGNTKAAQVEMSYLEAEAERLGLRYLDMANSYASFADAAQGANFSMEDTRRIFKAVSEASVVMNVSAEDTQGIFKALGQIMSKGKVQAEELRGQLGDRMTGAFNLMAQALGVTTGELDKMLQQGEVFANRNTLVGFADVLTQRYGKQLPEALRGTQAEINRWESNLSKAQQTIAESGFLDAFTQSLREINDWFQSDEGETFFEGLGVALGKLVSVFPEILKNLDAFVLAFQIFAGLKIAKVLNSLVPAIAGVIAQTGTMRGAWAAASAAVTANTIAMQLNASVATGAVAVGYRAAAGAMSLFSGVVTGATVAWRALSAAFLANPIGAVITAVTLFASFVLPSMITGTDAATDTLRDHEEALRKIEKAYADAEGEQDKFLKGLDDLSLTDAEKRLETLNGEIEKNERIAGQAFVAVRHLNYNYRDLAIELQRVSDGYKNGTIGSEEYRKSLVAIYNQLPENERGVRQWIAGMIDATAKAESLRAKVPQLQAVVNTLTGQFGAAEKGALGLSGALQGLNNSAANTSGLDAYTAAMAKLAQQIPELKRAADLAADIQTNTDAFSAGAYGLYQNSLNNGGKRIVRNGQEVKGNDAVFGRDQAAFLRGQLSPADQKRLDDLLARTVQGDAAVTKANAPKPTKEESQAMRDAKKRIADQIAYNEELRRAAELRELEIKWMTETEREARILEEINRAQYEAKQKGITLSDDQVDRIRQTVGAEYDANEAARVREQVEKSKLELLEAQGATLTREQHIMQALGVTSLANLTAEQKAWAEIEGKIYDVTQAEKAREDQRKTLDQNVAGYEAQQQATMDAIEFAREQGDTAAVDQLEAQLKRINAAYIEALEAKKAFWQSQADAGNPQAQAEIMAINNTIARLKVLDQKVLFSGKMINEQLAQGLAGAFDQFAAAVADGQNAWEAAGTAFRQFAADFLRQIAQMIIQQMLLNLLSGGTAGSGGGIGGALSGLLNGVTKVGVAHTGGTVGETQLARRSVLTSAFANAQRFHVGGQVGLKPGEVPIIAKQGEVIDPGDGSVFAKTFGGAAQQPVVNQKIVNLVKAVDMFREAMADEVGQKLLVNVIRDNSRAVNGALAG